MGGTFGGVLPYKKARGVCRAIEGLKMWFW